MNPELLKAKRETEQAREVVRNLLALFRPAPAGGKCDDTPAIVNADYEDEVEAALKAARKLLKK
jgi:hypothetical protein